MRRGLPWSPHSSVVLVPGLAKLVVWYARRSRVHRKSRIRVLQQPRFVQLLGKLWMRAPYRYRLSGNKAPGYLRATYSRHYGRGSKQLGSCQVDTFSRIWS